MSTTSSWDTLDAGVLVQDTFDLDFHHRRSGHGGQQHAPQRVAQSVAETALKGLHDNSRVIIIEGLNLDGPRLQKLDG